MKIRAVFLLVLAELGLAFSLLKPVPVYADQPDQQSSSQQNNQQTNTQQNTDQQSNQQNNSQPNNQQNSDQNQQNNQNNGQNSNNNSGQNNQQIPDGWKIVGKKRYYYINQKKLTGWQDLEGQRYYFAADGHMAQGVTKIGKSSYLFSRAGLLQVGLKKYGKYWYLASNTGKLLTGRQKVSSKSYGYFSTKNYRRSFKSVKTKKTYYWISKKSGNITGMRLEAKVIGQRPLVTGCEITAAAMMLNYAGKKISKYQAAAATPRNSNPNLGFVGNPYSWTGTWIAPLGLGLMVRKFLGQFKNMSGSSLSTLKKQVWKHHPVVVWVSWVDHFPNHALLLTGYSGSKIYYNDPWTGKKAAMSAKNFWYHYSTLKWLSGSKRALSY
ncbi:Hypothetical conserved protein [Lactobacillus equicursoris DSM 19284 = JCM 14600 = CIP 110162]|uniref:Peptidase C39-like domain-containing protein n=1 Tax=Lactobacillus equicursoris DSM 19284 = JCM 14600 = CIP 110162 TaxID=1293597 RepID=K0NWE7_9LACO|nr:C39 family peptidase [Lactobacillus equicursoris]KRL01469.1 hypothetical protein FC20_GL000880 [Lactobacillus equicursoris DSM 19284 = JCM 14600 = CIP 110162]CCK85176.1 Hypothetical conserved protein [Lactobacillus equicursoris DSM 19284 = JCM 14600 = CIP 110162]